MPLLKNLLPLRTIALRYIARNLELFWKRKWKRELRKITKASDDILLDIPSVLRLEIMSYLCRGRPLDVKALLLLLDHKSLCGSLDRSVIVMKLNVRYVGALIARRCKISTSLSLDALSFAIEPRSQRVAVGIVSRMCTGLASPRLQYTEYAIVKVIGTSLNNLEELFLVKLEDKYDDAIEFLVAGCPKLKILHVERGVTLESVEYLLLGLPNLIEFKHPLMALALMNIIQCGKGDRVSSLRTLYHDDGISDFTGVHIRKSIQTVMNYLIKMTKLHIRISHKLRKSVTDVSVTVSTLIHLTELTWHHAHSYGDTLVVILEAVGHQLRLLDWYCYDYPSNDVIDQCRKLRVLRITIHAWNMSNQSHDRDLHEPFTPFQHLQELDLRRLNSSHFKPRLFKSLIASPVLRELKLLSIPMFTDHIVEAAFNHVNHRGEQLAFTSLRKLMLRECDFITNNLKNIVTHDRVPLELLFIYGCSGLTERHLWNMERFDMEVYCS